MKKVQSQSKRDRLGEITLHMGPKRSEPFIKGINGSQDSIENFQKMYSHNGPHSQQSL